MSALSNFSYGGVTGVYDFAVSGAPPFTELKVFINGTDFTKLVAPADSNFTIGSKLITDGSGYAAGKLILIKAYGSLVSDSDFNVTFYDASNNNKVSTGVINNVSIAPDASVNNTRPSGVIPSSSVGSSAVTNVNDVATIGVSNKDIINPLTQTFYVDAVTYPSGVLVTSIVLYFASKDTAAPVGIQIRKMVGGVPSSTEYIANSVDYLDSAEVSVPTNPTNGPAVPTTFKVHCHLPPGEYAICILTDSPNYSMYYADYGLVNSGISNSYNDLTTREPFVGKMYKPQNTNLWVEEQNKSLCFEVKIAKFESGLNRAFEVTNAEVPYTEYDNMYLDVMEVIPHKYSSVNWRFKGTFASDGLMSEYEPISSNTAKRLLRRRKIQNAGDAVFEASFNSVLSTYASPIVDKNSLSLYTIKNLIDPFDNDIRNSELLPQNGVAQSRYLSKIIVINEEFASTGLEVRLDVNRKVGTDIDVFCRVMSPNDIGDGRTIENLPWRRMPLFNQRASVLNPNSLEGTKQYAGLSDDFSTEVYKILEQDSAETTGIDNLYYQATVNGYPTTFTSFNKFQIKIVMYSDDSSIVPRIKNLIATAVV